MMVKWADAFFRNGLVISVHLLGAQWPEPFMADRRFLFVGFDWESALRDSAHARSQFRAHAALLENQLADGRDFLCGDSPSLVDAHAHPFVWMANVYFPDVARELLAGFDRVNGLVSSASVRWAKARAQRSVRPQALQLARVGQIGAEVANRCKGSARPARGNASRGVA